MVEWLDETTGELDDYLEKNGLKENTVILYLADNGWDGSGRDGSPSRPYLKAVITERTGGHPISNLPKAMARSPPAWPANTRTCRGFRTTL
jgi:arylsulfatase A-like enzyme